MDPLERASRWNDYYKSKEYEQHQEYLKQKNKGMAMKDMFKPNTGAWFSGGIEGVNYRFTGRVQGEGDKKKYQVSFDSPTDYSKTTSSWVPVYILRPEILPDF